MAEKHLKKCSTSLIIREIQMETTLRFHLTLVRIARIKISRVSKCWRGCRERGILLHCWWDCKLLKPLWKSVWKFLRKLNIVDHVSLLYVGASSGYMPWRVIPGSSGSTMSNFLRNHQTDFQSGFTSLQSHQQWRSVPPSPHPHQHLLSPEFFISPILTSRR